MRDILGTHFPLITLIEFGRLSIILVRIPKHLLHSQEICFAQLIPIFLDLDLFLSDLSLFPLLSPGWILSTFAVGYAYLTHSHAPGVLLKFQFKNKRTQIRVR